MKRMLALLFATLLVWPPLAHAQGSGGPDPATIDPLTAPGTGEVNVIEYGTNYFAYVFKVNQPLLVNAVGISFFGAAPATFKLFDGSGTNLISQPVVPYANDVTVVGDYNYKSVNPLTLQAGIYVIAVGPVFSMPDSPAVVHYVEYGGQDQGAYISPLITVLGGTVYPTSQFNQDIANAVIDSAVSHYGMPNYLSSVYLTGTLSAAPVPEADMYAMLIVGLAVFGFVRRRQAASPATFLNAFSISWRS